MGHGRAISIMCINSPMDLIRNNAIVATIALATAVNGHARKVTSTPRLRNAGNNYPDQNSTQYLYQTYPKVTNPLEGVMNEHFAVWMRTAALPKFRKLYGYFDKTIKKGETLSFNINANWVVKDFEGSKSLIVTTTSIFGGRNPKFAKIFIYGGYACLGVGFLFGLKHWLQPRKLADPKYLKYKAE